MTRSQRFWTLAASTGAFTGFVVNVLANELRWFA